MAVGAGACTKEPAAHYRFSPAQLAWQPYQQGQVLRFGNGRTSAVRTYKVNMVTDEEYQYNTFLSKNRPYFQALEAHAGRTDSTSNGALSVASLVFDQDATFPGQLSAKPAPVVARVSWPGYYTAVLPVDELNSRNQPDSLAFQSLKLVLGLALGPTTYAQAVRIRIPMQRAGTPVATLYYARGSGVVGFQEYGGGLWYRLP